jgi:serine/threonine protein kinase
MAAPPEGSATDRVLGDRYRLESIIGVGGMATVYRANDEALGRPVAVKLFDRGSLDPEREEAELAVLAALDHHALVNLFDAGVAPDDNGRPQRYIVMALVVGANLLERVNSAPIATRHIAEIGYDMAEALDYIHSHNVIHRDVKPSNILLVDYGNDAPRARAKLTDFGIALSDDVDRMTAEGATTGTAAYLSPEQVTGGTVGPATDIYSLGLVLLQCFTRQVEFPGPIVESAIARVSRDPHIPSTLPEHWQTLLAAMTARDPSARPARHELVSALRQIIIAESGRHKDLEEEAFQPLESSTSEISHPEVLDTLPNEALHRVTAMAARLFSAPISIVSVVDHDRTWFRSHYGAEVKLIARAVDLSTATVPLEYPVVIEDGRTDPRTQSSSLVTGPLGLRFYVGVPLKRQDGSTIGTLSVLDFVPGTASEAEIANLQDLAALVVAQLELRQEGIRAGEVSGSVPVPAPIPASEVPGPANA